MNRTSKSIFIVTLAVVLWLASPACRTKSTLDKVLEQRARWTVLALDWTQTKDHVVLLSTRLNGPSNSPLDRLTVCIVLKDAAGATIEEMAAMVFFLEQGSKTELAVLNASGHRDADPVILTADEAEARNTGTGRIYERMSDYLTDGDPD